MFFFILCGFLSFLMSWHLNPKKTQSLWMLSGISFGLAMACKWPGVLGLFTCLGIILVIRLLQFWKTRFQKKFSKWDWYQPKLWQSTPLITILICWCILPLCTYLITFTPLLSFENFPHKGMSFFQYQWAMWKGHTQAVRSHLYQSHWHDWILLKRPIWYAFDHNENTSELIRGVALIGNPLLMWCGVVSILICLRDGFLKRSFPAFFIFLAYFVFTAFWAIIPRQISFYYYYYPAGMMLSFALTYAIYYSPLFALSFTFFGTLLITLLTIRTIFLKQVEIPLFIYWLGVLGCLGICRYVLIKSKTIKIPQSTLACVFAIISFLIFIYFFPVLSGMEISLDTFRHRMWLVSWI